MKRNLFLIVTLFFSFSIFANGVSQTNSNSVSSNTTTEATNTTPSVAEQPTRSITVTIEAGSLRANLRRLAQQFGWNKLIWKVPNDYTIPSPFKITSTSFANIVSQLLTDLPVKAVFYEANKTIVIIPGYTL